MKRLTAALIVLFAGTAQLKGKELVDPFVNPIAIRIKEAEKEVKLKEKLKSQESREVRLFIPKIKVPFDSLSIQGVIKGNGKYLLVLMDPKTGETFFLKEGDAVAPDEKILKITPDEVVLVKYERVKGRVIRKKIILNVDTEGSSNG
ncbi:hypothetical protein [Thermovibrio sp.]